MLPSVPKALKMWYEEFILPIITNFQAGTKTQDIITTARFLRNIVPTTSKKEKPALMEQATESLRKK